MTVTHVERGVVGDETASRLISMPGQEGKFAALVATLTDAGRDALQ